MNKCQSILMALLLLCAQGASADIIGVSDAELITLAFKQLTALRDQYQLLKDSYKNSEDQLKGIERLKSMNSGSYGFGELSNGLDELQSWQSPTNTWDDALQNLSGGDTSRYQSLVAAYEKNHPNLNDAAITKTMTPMDAKQFKEDKAVNRAVQVQTTDAYNEINKHMASLQALSKHIEKTPNTKGAIDLNSRLLTEVAFIELMSVRLQTLISQQLSQDSLSELSDRAEMARFNQIPK